MSNPARQDGEHCLTCGYNLRATPDKCPECGTVVTLGLPLRFELDTAALASDFPTAAIVPRSPEADEHPVLLFDTQNNVQASLLVDQLQARGVEARLKRGNPVTVLSGYQEQSVVYWKVLIWSADAEGALATAGRFRRRDVATEA